MGHEDQEPETAYPDITADDASVLTGQALHLSPIFQAEGFSRLLGICNRSASLPDLVNVSIVGGYRYGQIQKTLLVYLLILIVQSLLQ